MIISQGCPGDEALGGSPGGPPPRFGEREVNGLSIYIYIYIHNIIDNSNKYMYNCICV